jgi:hypothetical protein
VRVGLDPLPVYEDDLDPAVATHHLGDGMYSLAGMLGDLFGTGSGEIRAEDPTEFHGFVGAHKHLPQLVQMYEVEV